MYIIEAYRENLCYSRRIALFSRCTGNQLTSAFKNGGNSRNDKNNFFLIRGIEQNGQNIIVCYNN